MLWRRCYSDSSGHVKTIHPDLDPNLESAQAHCYFKEDMEFFKYKCNVKSDDEKRGIGVGLLQMLAGEK